MSAWSIYHDGHQRRQEGLMTLSVKPVGGCYEWKIARFGAVVAGGKEWHSYQAIAAADKKADELKPIPAPAHVLAERAKKMDTLTSAVLDGLREEGYEDAEHARQISEGLVMWPPRTLKECASVRYACKRLGIKNSYKAIRAYVEGELTHDPT